MRMIEKKYAGVKTVIDRTDGLSMEFDSWRFNLRMSNTEPVLRLNVETHGDEGLLKKKTEELLAVIDSNTNML